MNRCAPGIAFLLAVFVAGVAVGEGELVYSVRVEGLACPFCVHGIEKQLLAVEGVARVETELEAGVVVVTMRPGSVLEEAAARKAVEDAGFKFGGLTRHAAPE